MTPEGLANQNSIKKIYDISVSPYDIDYMLIFSSGETISKIGTTISSYELKASLLDLINNNELLWNNNEALALQDRYPQTELAFDNNILDMDNNNIPTKEQRMLAVSRIVHNVLTHNSRNELGLWTKDVIIGIKKRYDLLIPTLDSKNDSIYVYNVAVARLNKRVYPSSRFSHSGKVTSIS